MPEISLCGSRSYQYLKDNSIRAVRAVDTVFLNIVFSRMDEDLNLITKHFFYIFFVGTGTGNNYVQFFKFFITLV